MTEIEEKRVTESDREQSDTEKLDSETEMEAWSHCFALNDNAQDGEIWEAR